MGALRPRTPGLLCVTVLSIAVAAGVSGAASAGFADPRAESSTVRGAPIVPEGALLVVREKRRLDVLDRRGRLVRRLRQLAIRAPVQAIEVAPDRRHAYVAVYVVDRPPRLYELDLASGAMHAIGAGASPVLSPDVTRLAYFEVRRVGDIELLTALVVRNLVTSSVRFITFGSGAPPEGTPPELVVNWSPDGERVVLVDGHALRIVDVASATGVRSQPAIAVPALAPVFLDARTLVVLTDCCIGRQSLAAIDLGSGAMTPFAQLDAPPETLRRLAPGQLLAVTALRQLVVVTRGRTKVVARGVIAAAS